MWYCPVMIYFINIYNTNHSYYYLLVSTIKYVLVTTLGGCWFHHLILLSRFSDFVPFVFWHYSQFYLNLCINLNNGNLVWFVSMQELLISTFYNFKLCIVRNIKTLIYVLANMPKWNDTIVSKLKLTNYNNIKMAKKCMYLRLSSKW